MEAIYSPEALLAKAESAPVVFTKFTLLIDRYGENVTYCFVEGYDMPYYINPVRFIIGKEPIEIKCDGKENVVAANRYIESKPEYAHYTKRYFVDKDYTDNSTIPNSVCITEGYAIENYYLVDECVERILRNEFKFDIMKNAEEFKKCMNYYHEQHEKFEESIQLFNAWYCCLREDERWNHKSVSLGISFPAEWMDCKIGSFTATYSLSDIQAKYPNAPIIQEQRVKDMMIICKQKGWYYMRGKYEIQFLFTFLRFLQNEPKKSRVYSVSSCQMPFAQSSMISTFSQYAYIPDSLKEYIKTGFRNEV